MTFEEYQKEADSTAIYNSAGNNFIYPTLGLAGEAGEIANKIKKIERDNSGVITQELKDSIKSELGDVLWYIARIATEFGFTIEDVAQKNVSKILSRKEREMIHGDGDYR